MLLLSNPIGNSTVMYDQSVLGKFEVPPIRKRNDFALWLKILKQTPVCAGMDDVLTHYRVRTNSVSSNKLAQAKYHWQLYREIEGLHCHKAFECAPCLAAASRAGVPVRIAHAHNPESYAMGKGLTARMRKALYGVYRRIIWRYATHMVACSTETADDVYGRGKGIVLCNSIDTQQFSLARYPVVAHTGLRLIHVGRFSKQKNQLFLVDVLNALKDRCPDVRLVMVGEQNDYLDAVKRKAEQKGLSESVVFLPHDSGIPALLAEADAFVLPSTYEGFGIVLLEAQAMGLPCFVSSVVTKEVDCGLLSYIGLEDGAEKWAEQIAEKTIVSNTRRQGAFVSRFEVKTVAQNWLRLYRGQGEDIL